MKTFINVAEVNTYSLFRFRLHAIFIIYYICISAWYRTTVVDASLTSWLLLARDHTLSYWHRLKGTESQDSKLRSCRRNIRLKESDLQDHTLKYWHRKIRLKGSASQDPKLSYWHRKIKLKRTELQNHKLRYWHRKIRLKGTESWGIGTG